MANNRQSRGGQGDRDRSNPERNGQRNDIQTREFRGQGGGGRRRNRNRSSAFFSGFGVPRGPYTGLGPKGYNRSDDRIREDVSGLLSQHGHIDARNVEVNVKNGEVTLTGEMENRRMKLLTEEVIANIPGVRDVTNNIRVVSREGEPIDLTREPQGRTAGQQGFRATT
jgi:hypothetical protein